MKPAIHGRDNRDEGQDPISGPWFLCLDPGDTVPAGMEEDEDYVFLQNGWAQPPGNLEEFSFRRGLSKIDTKGHLQTSTSGTVALTIPAPYRLRKDQFCVQAVYDGATPIPAVVYFFSATGDVTITYPL
jgi:hypothetical protein